MSEFGIRLKILRKEKKLKQHDMAVRFGLSDSGYQSYEQGKCYPEVSKLLLLADFFDVSIDYLLGRSSTRERMP